MLKKKIIKEKEAVQVKLFIFAEISEIIGLVSFYA